jgi:hypothetical protein
MNLARTSASGEGKVWGHLVPELMIRLERLLRMRPKWHGAGAKVRATIVHN